MFLFTYTAVLSLMLIVFVRPGALGLQDVTGDLFGSENVGTVAAFGDFNSDKQTDVFVIREGEYLLSVLLANANTDSVFRQMFTFYTVNK